MDPHKAEGRALEMATYLFTAGLITFSSFYHPFSFRSRLFQGKVWLQEAATASRSLDGDAKATLPVKG